MSPRRPSMWQETTARHHLLVQNECVKGCICHQMMPTAPMGVLGYTHLCLPELRDHLGFHSRYARQLEHRH